MQYFFSLLLLRNSKNDNKTGEVSNNVSFALNGSFANDIATLFFHTIVSDFFRLRIIAVLAVVSERKLKYRER